MPELPEPGRAAPTVTSLLRRLYLVALGVLLALIVSGVTALFTIRLALNDFRNEVTALVSVVEQMQVEQYRAESSLGSFLLLGDQDSRLQFQDARASVKRLSGNLTSLAQNRLDDAAVSGHARSWQEWARQAELLVAERATRAQAAGAASAAGAVGAAGAAGATGAVGDEGSAAAVADLLRQGRVANDELAQVAASAQQLRVERRTDYDNVITRSLLAIPAIGLSGALALWLLVRGVGRQLTDPLTRLRAVVLRETHRRPTVHADTRTGTREVRAVAHAFNEMTARQSEVLAESERALALQRTTGSVAQIVGAAGGQHIDWTMACRVLGHALGADGATVHLRGGPHLSLAGFWVDSTRMGDPMLHRDDLRLGVLEDPVFSDDVVVFDGETAVCDPEGPVTMVVAPVMAGRERAGVLAVWARSHGFRSAEVQACRRFADLAGRTVAEQRFVDTLLEVDRQKSEFVATTSHELRTPLTSIHGYLEMLHDGDFGALTDRQRVATEVIERNVARLRLLIEDLLELNRRDLGRGTGAEELIDLPATVTRVMENLMPLAADSRLRVQVRAEGDTQVRGDRDQVERALTNVVANAVKFTPPGGTVAVSVAELGRSVTVTVRDTGVGIPAAELSSIFTRFFRASNAVRNTVPGTGLGLAIARGIVEAHGGQIRVSSVQDEGTTVELVLPMAEPRV